jgi:hypothetical protein
VRRKRNHNGEDLHMRTTTDTGNTPTAGPDTDGMTQEGRAGGTERDDLVDTLEKHRAFLRYTVRGLTDEEAARRSTVSELCLGGLIKHVTMVEKQWVEFIEHGPSVIGSPDEAAMESHAASFRMLDGDTLQDLLAAYQLVADRTDDLVRSLPSLDRSHPLPDAPWFEPGARWSARRVLLHVVAETAQHAGHADIVREAIDGGKTMG